MKGVDIGGHRRGWTTGMSYFVRGVDIRYIYMSMSIYVHVHPVEMSQG